MAKILLVDDDSTTLRNLALFLRSEGYEVDEAHNGSEASERLAEDGVDLLVSDVMMPGINGLRLLERAQCVAPDVPVLLMSAFANIDPDQLKKLGAADLIEKPLLLDDLLDKVKRALASRPTVSA